jgi:hypothetical protein
MVKYFQILIFSLLISITYAQKRIWVMELILKLAVE